MRQPIIDTPPDPPEEERMIVVTHDGRHHADELLACWFFQVLQGNDNIRIVRTSDHRLYRHADVLLDCGGHYDPQHDRLDHHGRSRTPTPPEGRGCGYATAGLVWRQHGERICELVLDEAREGPWLEFRDRLEPEQQRECYRLLADLLDREIVSTIDSWDLGIYPPPHLSRLYLPFQWLLPHLDFDVAMEALGKAFTHRLRMLAEIVAGEANLEHDLWENGPCEFFAFGPWLVVRAPNGKRIEVLAAKRFAQRVMQMPLLAVVSSLRGGTRWGAFLTTPLPADFRIPHDVEFAAGRRTLFHSNSERLLGLLKKLEQLDALPRPPHHLDSGA